MANVGTRYNDQYGYNSLNGSSDENVQVVGAHSTFPSGSSGQYGSSGNPLANTVTTFIVRNDFMCLDSSNDTTIKMSYVTKTIKWSGDILLTRMAITIQIIYSEAYCGQNSQYNLSMSERPNNGLNQILEKYRSDTKETSKFFTKRYKQFL